MDLNISSKLLEKMWDSLVNKGVGGLLEPWHNRRLGKAETDIKADSLIRLAEAEILTKGIASGELKLPYNALNVNYDLEDTSKTVDKLESSTSLTRSSSEPDTENSNQIIQASTSAQAAEAIRKEVNVARAILEAEDELKNNHEEPSQESVEDDWLYRWRDYAGGVSNSELQGIWGRILAGETCSPGTYSLRTLEFIKNISQSEAQQIAKLAPFIVDDFISEKSKVIDEQGISFDDLLSLQAMGLVTGVDSLALAKTYSSVESNRFVCIIFRNSEGLVVTSEDNSKQIQIRCSVITPLGKEVFALCPAGLNKGYMLELGRCIVKQGFDVGFTSGIRKKGDGIEWSGLESIEDVTSK